MRGIVFEMSGMTDVLLTNCRVNELYQEVCEKDSTLAYDIEF